MTVLPEQCLCFVLFVFVLLFFACFRIYDKTNEASTAYGMEISAEKTKLMTNNTSGINTEIKVNGQL